MKTITYYAIKSSVAMEDLQKGSWLSSWYWPSNIGGKRVQKGFFFSITKLQYEFFILKVSHCLQNADKYSKIQICAL